MAIIAPHAIINGDGVRIKSRRGTRIYKARSHGIGARSEDQGVARIGKGRISNGGTGS